MLPVLHVSGLNKSFVMHAQGDLALPVLRDVALSVAPGECLALGAEAMLGRGGGREEARGRAECLLGVLGIPEGLWSVPPATFSGGEQRRVNIARSLIADYPVLLLDEPTASLDQANRDGVIDLIRQRREAGAALVGIFHDVAVREALATPTHNVSLPGGQP